MSDLAPHKCLPRRTNKVTHRGSWPGPQCRAMSLVYNLTAAGSSMMSAQDGQSDFPLENRPLLGLFNPAGPIPAPPRPHPPSPAPTTHTPPTTPPRLTTTP